MSTTDLHILGVTGGVARESVSAAMVEAVLAEARRRGARVRTCDALELALPPYELREDPPGRGLVVARALVSEADALVLGTPDYHGGPAGWMKNFLDQFWREFGGKLFALAVSSYEKGLTVHDQLRTTIRQCYGWVLPYGASASQHDTDGSGSLVNPRVTERLRMMGRDLVVYGGLIARRRALDLAERDPAVPGFMARVGAAEEEADDPGRWSSPASRDDEVPT
jgi:NAD(P)H-dependent FMN reductase